MQYYTVARYAALACLMPVCGNIYHHAIEMFLKGGLSQKYTLEQMKNLFFHKLPPLWSAFKKEFSSVELVQFDNTIDTINKFETIRYPDKIIEGIELWLMWEQDNIDIDTAYQIIVPDI